MYWRQVFLSSRPPFLILTPACLLPGFALAIYLHQAFNGTNALLVVIGALCAHISVNSLNEYSDFFSGLDLQTAKTPFSGGSGSLPQCPEARFWVLAMGLVTLAVTIVIGIYLLTRSNQTLLVVGLVGIFIILVYTRYLNRLPWLCLVAPGIAFGPLFVMGSYLGVSGRHQLTPMELQVVLMVSLVPFFLCNNLLLLNQIPDVDADEEVGRRTFPIAYGIRQSLKIYGLFTVLTALVIIVNVVTGMLPWFTLMALLPLVLGVFVYNSLYKTRRIAKRLIKNLGRNVICVIATIFSYGLLIVLAALINN